MQKKSLLVALFCGALCLTGCLKNEESPSVAEVRGAKAEELKASAALKNAKAQAEVIYANAEATLKQAQAALLNAQAETEKVRAELLKVQVKLGEVKVEEEKVELQKRQAELEVLLAQAEAGKQFWVNALNNLLAQAEIDALQNEQDILDAIAAFEDNSAEGAALYAGKYYAALQQVQALELQQLAIKAEKVLVQTGVKAAKKSLNFEIEQIDKKIAENEAIVAALKEKQTMTPEEAEAALKDARIALSEAYTDYQNAMEARIAAETAYNNLAAMTVEFTQGWSYAFKDDFKEILEGSDVYTYGHDLVAELEVEGHEGYVMYSGVYVNDEDDDPFNDVFVPLWTSKADAARWARDIQESQRYPDIHVYKEGEGTDFVTLTTTTIAPAKIDFEAVDGVLDDLAEEVKAQTADANEFFEKVIVPAHEADLKDEIKDLEDELDLHTKYVAERKTAVKAAEDAFVSEYKANKQLEDNKEVAWEAFQEHMLLKHDVDRMLFIQQNDAQKAFDKADDDLTTATNAYNAAVTAVATAEEKIAPALEAEAKAEGVYNVAVNKSVSATVQTAWEEAQAGWNPKFDPKKEVRVEGGKYYNTKKSGELIVIDPETEAKPAQAELYVANQTLAQKEEALVAAQEYLWRNPEGSANYEAAKNDYDAKLLARNNQQTTVSTKQTAANTAEKTYNDTKKIYEAAAGTEEVEKAKADWNPEFGQVKQYIEGPINTTTGEVYKIKSTVEQKAGKWVLKSDNKIAAGTKQAAVLDAIATYKEKYDNVNTNGTAAKPSAKKVKDDATVAKTTAQNNLTAANNALIAAVKGSPATATDKIADYLDADGVALYRKYEAAVKAYNEAKHEAWAKLVHLYTYNPNHIGEYDEAEIANLWTNPVDAQYSWWYSSYMVDYTAQVLTPDCEWVYIAELIDDAEYDEDEEELVFEEGSFSNAWQIEQIKDQIANLPAYLEAFKAFSAMVEQMRLAEIENIRANVMDFEHREAEYTAWLADLSEAEEAVNEAMVAEFDAEVVANVAKAVYVAIDAVANEGMWIFVGDAEDVDDDDCYVFVTIQEAIEHFEGTSAALNECVLALADVVSATVNIDLAQPSLNVDVAAFITTLAAYADEYGDSIVELNIVKKVLEKVVEYSDIAEETVLEMLDEHLQWNEEQIAILTAIAEKYKTVMFAYLGIDETGPLAGEEE